VIEKARSMTNWADFFYAFVKGAGWFPGTGRLGDITFVAEVDLLLDMRLKGIMISYQESSPRKV